MIFEEFDRLAPDLTLSEIIAARRRGKLKINQEPRKAGGFKNSEVIAAKLRALREALTRGTKPKPPVTHMNRSVLLRRITEFDARLDRIIHGGDGSPSSRHGLGAGRLHEFALLPALAGGVLGSGVGSKLSGKKYNAATGRWEDDQGNETSAPGVSSALGGVAGAGAGYGASKLHGGIMKGYGGEGGVGQAYRNVARNVGAQAGQKVTDAIAPGFAEGSELLKKIRKGGSSVLKRFFEANAPRLIELEARLDATLKKKASGAGQAVEEVTEFARGDVLMRQLGKWRGMQPKSIQRIVDQGMTGPHMPMVNAALRRDYTAAAKEGIDSDLIDAVRKSQARAILKQRKTGILKKKFKSLNDLIAHHDKSMFSAISEMPSTPSPVHFFAQPDNEKKRSFVKPYVAGLLTVPAIGAAAAAAGPGRHMLSGAADAIRQRYYKARFPAGSNIPSNKIVEYLRMLHAGKIKA